MAVREKKRNFGAIKLIIRIMYKHIFSIFLMVTASISMSAQKLTLGTCTTRDGGEYKGEMVAGKPHGKGKATYKNGNWYEGQYAKGKREGYGVYTFADGELLISLAQLSSDDGYRIYITSGK